MNLADLESRAKALLPGAAPAAAFVASEPASQGGASTPLLWLAVFLVLNFAAVADAAAFWGLPAAVAFCNSNTAQTAVVAVLVPLVSALLAYRSVNKRTAARVAIAAAQANGGAAPEAKGATDG